MVASYNNSFIQLANIYLDYFLSLVSLSQVSFLCKCMSTCFNNIGELRHFTGDEDVDTYLPRLTIRIPVWIRISEVLHRTGKDILQGKSHP